jgi:hypothetical protein
MVSEIQMRDVIYNGFIFLAVYRNSHEFHVEIYHSKFSSHISLYMRRKEHVQKEMQSIKSLR